jgi:uncharacterized membrane protein YkvA (DUF1232 family)
MNFSTSYHRFVQYFNEHDFFKKIAKFSGKLGEGALYHLFLLFFMLADKNIPYRKRVIIMAALGYFILPTDFIGDFIPVLGFTDDVSFLIYAVSSVNEHITPELSEKAKNAVEKLSRRKILKKR